MGTPSADLDHGALPFADYLKDTGSRDIHHRQVVRVEQGKIATINKSVRKICTFLHISLESIEGAEPTSIAARVERLIREAPQSMALLRSTVEILEQMLLHQDK